MVHQCREWHRGNPCSLIPHSGPHIWGFNKLRVPQWTHQMLSMKPSLLNASTLQSVGHTEDHNNNVEKNCESQIQSVQAQVAMWPNMAAESLTSLNPPTPNTHSYLYLTLMCCLLRKSYVQWLYGNMLTFKVPLNLHSSYCPAGGSSTGCKKETDRIEVYEKMSLLLTWFITSVNWFQMILWS